MRHTSHRTWIGWTWGVLTLGLLVTSAPARARDHRYNQNNAAATALFHMGGSAGGQAMGGAYASLSRGPESMYWNPGGLAYQRSRYEVCVSPRVVRAEDEDAAGDNRSYFLVQGGWRWRTWVVGASLVHHEIGNLLFNDGASNEVDPGRTFGNSQSGVSLALGRTFLSDHLGVGACLRRLSNSLHGTLGYMSSDRDTRGTGLSLALGGLYRVNEDISGGVAYEPPARVDWGRVHKDESSSRLQAAASYRFFRSSSYLATAAAQLENTGWSWVRLNVGAEFVVLRRVSLRAGYRNLHLRSSSIDVADLNEASTATFGVGTADLRILGKVPVALDVAFDAQDFNSQTAATLRVGF